MLNKLIVVGRFLFGGGEPITGKAMKKYINPTTDCVELRATSAILLESGEGSKTDPGDIDEGMGLAPSRPWAF